MEYLAEITQIIGFLENSIPVLQSTLVASTFADFAYERINQYQFSYRKWGGAAPPQW
jgi:hypothetical protein